MAGCGQHGCVADLDTVPTRTSTGKQEREQELFGLPCSALIHSCTHSSPSHSLLLSIYTVPGTGGIRDQTHDRSCSWDVQSGGKETGGGGVGWRESPELKSGGRVLDLGSSSPFLVTVGQLGLRVGVLSYLGGFSHLQMHPPLSWESASHWGIPAKGVRRDLGEQTQACRTVSLGLRSSS